MQVTVVFPKGTVYHSADVNSKSAYITLFRKYVDMLENAGCKVEYCIEDELADDFLEEYCNKKMVTCIPKTEFAFARQYREHVQVSDYICNLLDTVECKAPNVTDKFRVPIHLASTDREAYFKQRIESFRKKLRYSTDNYLSNSRNVLMFIAGNGRDRCTPVRLGVKQGDGRLVIEVNVDSGIATSYYGGQYITEDYLPTILSM